MFRVAHLVLMQKLPQKENYSDFLPALVVLCVQ